MTKQTISVGTVSNDGTGDNIRDSMIKVNDNFTELYSNAPVSNSISVGNSSVNTYINSTSISTKHLTLSGDLSVTGNVSFEGETLFSNAINITTTDKLFILANGSATATAANNSGIVIASYANLVYQSISSAWVSNVGIIPSANNLAAGNTTNRWSVYANTIDASGLITGTSGATITGTTNSSISFQVGSSFIANTSGVYHTGRVNAISYSTGNVSVGTGGFLANTTVLVFGNNTVNTSINSTAVVINTNTGLTVGNSSATANGYTFLPNGFKMNWGWVSSNSSIGAVIFSSAFTTNAFSITATTNTITSTYQPAVTAWDKTSATILTGNTTSTNVFWMAIGK